MIGYTGKSVRALADAAAADACDLWDVCVRPQEATGIARALRPSRRGGPGEFLILPRLTLVERRPVEQ